MATRSLANVIPDDDGDNQTTSQTASVPAQQDTSASPAAEADEPTNAESNSPQQATQPAEKKPRKTSQPSGQKAQRSSATSTSTKNQQQATSAQQQRPGRPRIPKAGDTTRVTLDLAVTEQTQLETLTGKIGRAIDRGRGKNKIYPQHVIRVAVRRLLTDDDFRAAVTEDLREGRDELKRTQK